jgi:hypothetical protein
VSIAVSLILIAFGAILTWAVQTEPEGLDLTVVGVVLMLVGFTGLVLTLLLWSEWGPRTRSRRRYVEDDATYRDYPTRREVVVDEDREVVRPRRQVVEEDREVVHRSGPPPP